MLFYVTRPSRPSPFNGRCKYSDVPISTGPGCPGASTAATSRAATSTGGPSATVACT